MKKLRKNRKGFTLVEVVVVLVIIAILIAIAVPAVMKYVDDANDAKFEAQARGAYIAAESALVKDYSEDGNLDHITIPANLNKLVGDQISIPVEIEVYKDSTTKLGAKDSPNLAKIYKIKLTDAKKLVTIEKNGKVTVANAS